MASISHFRELAYLVSVSDICSPFLASFEGTRTVAEVFEWWSVDICFERNLDPNEQLALVTTEGRVVGWIGFDMLEAGKQLIECMEPITPDSILSSDTSLFDAVTAFATSPNHFFLVLRGNHFIGWLSYTDLHKPPLRLCLFAMLINLERMLLEVALRSPKESVQVLPDGRKENARKVYAIRKYNYSDTGEPYESKLLECTTIIDKFTIARRTKTVLSQVPTLDNVSLCNTAERVRNEIAHPGLEEQSSDLLSRENLWQFIQWAETLESQLQKYLESARGF
jgi:hypothetical protein